MPSLLCADLVMCQVVPQSISVAIYSYILSKCQTKKVQEQILISIYCLLTTLINLKCFAFLMCAKNDVLYINMYRNALGVKTGTQ